MHPAKTLMTAALLIFASGSYADFHFQRDADEQVSEQEQQLAAEINAFLADYAVAYNNQDYRTVKNMWSGDGNPIYMAEEVPFPLYGKKRLDNYFNPIPGRRILDGIYNEYSEVRAKYLTPEIAVATYRLDYDIKLVGMPASNGWDRVMAVFVKEEDEWKLSAYAEAPMGPATMVRTMMKATPAITEEEKAAYATTKATIKKLSQATVDESFAEFMEARKDLEPTH
ncbi:MAG: SnoaL-like domain-containing protein [Gammaproteobacteria bacterium]|nr:SnoaL-like domain-containing protein [Gammaproteobacteria bacterium]